MHRDSAGHLQEVAPGDASVMTAGRGIVHSERTTEAARKQGNTMFGQQVWLALPKSREEAEPEFVHYGASELPRIQGEGISATLIAGSAFGQRSPVATFSDTIYADVALAPHARFQIAPEHVERAAYVVSGTISVLGQAGEFAGGELVVFKPGAEIVLQARNAVRLMLIGGEPLPEKRFIYWNFVSSSMDRIEQAMADWRECRFAGVPGETEFIPLPSQDPAR